MIKKDLRALYREREDGHEVDTASEADYLLCLALDIGDEMLKNGGEISRVEDTVERICHAYGAEHVEVFTIPSLILAAIRMPGGAYSSQVRRIVKNDNHLFRLEQFNAISRKICRETPPLDQVDTMIREAKAKRLYPEWLRCVAAASAASAFTVFFGGGWRDALVAFALGLLIFLIDMIPFRHVNRLAKTVLQSFLGGLLACVSVIIGIGQNAPMIIIGTIMLLVPGLFFGTALRDLLSGDTLAGTLKTVQCFLTAMMIAAGYLLAMLLIGGVL